MSYHIPEKKFSEGLRLCLQNSKDLAKYSRILIKKNNVTFGFGLYTYAIEEYGKFVVMKNESSKSKKGYLVPKWIFGGRKKKRIHSHLSKFQRGLENLPDTCKSISLGKVRKTFSSCHDEEIKLESNEIITFMTATTGTIESFTDPDFEVRLRAFYLDWDDRKKDWILPYKPDRKNLLKSINGFLNHVPILD